MEPSKKEEVNKGAWTEEEDQKLAEVIASNGAKKWKAIATKTGPELDGFWFFFLFSGLNRCGKSCRLRWMNYLRPNIKRGNISDQEEDLIVRLHKLLGNRWSLIAGRLPGRTDNEIKNYWNSHLSKKTRQRHGNRESRKAKLETQKGSNVEHNQIEAREEETSKRDEEEEQILNFDVDEFFNFSNEGPLDWVSKFLDL